MTIQDFLAGNPQTQTFTYDALDRLSSALASGGTGGTYSLQSYSYSTSTGNLDLKAGVSYTYNSPGHAHAVSALSTGQTYQYDANGNQTQRVIGSDTYVLIFDAENRLVEVKKNGSTLAKFTYDGDGNRLKGEITGGATTTYIGSYFEWTGATNTMKKYYYAGATRVAMRTGSSTLNYLLGDHLGSQAITTNSSGVKSAEVRYYPWGTTRYTSGTTPTTFKFTGQRYESGIGLYFYGARFYDPSAGRFISADSIVPDAMNSQAYDRYAYTLNNPLKYVDPTGYLNGQPPLNNQQCGPDMIYCGGLGDPNNSFEVAEYQYAGGEITGEQYYDWLVDNGYFMVPSEYSLFTYGGQYSKRENYQTMGLNISWYREIRQKLFVDFGWVYIDKSGKIKDEALIAIIVRAEFGTTISDKTKIYEAALSALSNLYHSTRSPGNTGAAICFGSCTIQEQLIFIQIMQAIRTTSIDKYFNSTNSFKAYLPLATNIVAAPFGLYWMWGNVEHISQATKGDFQIGIPINGYYFYVYGYESGWNR